MWHLIWKKFNTDLFFYNFFLAFNIVFIGLPFVKRTWSLSLLTREKKDLQKKAVKKRKSKLHCPLRILNMLIKFSLRRSLVVCMCGCMCVCGSVCTLTAVYFVYMSITVFIFSSHPTYSSAYMCLSCWSFAPMKMFFLARAAHLSSRRVQHNFWLLDLNVQRHKGTLTCWPRRSHANRHTHTQTKTHILILLFAQIKMLKEHFINWPLTFYKGVCSKWSSRVGFVFAVQLPEFIERGNAFVWPRYIHILGFYFCPQLYSGLTKVYQVHCMNMCFKLNIF